MLRSNPAALMRLREGQGLSGRALAGRSGVSQARISELEGGTVGIRPATAKSLADALGVEIAAITISDERAEAVGS